LAEGDEVVEPGIEQTEDIPTSSGQQALAEEKERAEKYLVNWQRCQADFVNYKQRTEQEKKEIIEFANSALISILLPIMDDLARAFASVPAELDASNWTEGIKLIYNKFKATLEAQGLTEIEARGEPFDPHLHEAVMQQEGEDGIVVEETQKGYKFREKVIRPSLVIVGKGKAKEDQSKQLRRRSKNG
jgi:molecular chaperone GrpE